MIVWFLIMHLRGSYLFQVCVFVLAMICCFFVCSSDYGNGQNHTPPSFQMGQVFLGQVCRKGDSLNVTICNQGNVVRTPESGERSQDTVIRTT